MCDTVNRSSEVGRALHTKAAGRDGAEVWQTAYVGQTTTAEPVVIIGHSDDHTQPSWHSDDHIGDYLSWWGMTASCVH